MYAFWMHIALLLCERQIRLENRPPHNGLLLLSLAAATAAAAGAATNSFGRNLYTDKEDTRSA